MFKRMIEKSLPCGLLAAAVLVAIPSAAMAAPVCAVAKYGAKADGKTKDTAAIQAAIDDCAKKGGGTVVLASGTYLSAPIVLKSNITLHLDAGATLLGTTDFNDYPAITEFKAPGRQSLVSAHNAENISIDGAGTIDGAGQPWWDVAHQHRDAGVVGGTEFVRPRLLVFDHVKHLRIEGVTVQNSPMWQIVPYYSEDIVIRNVKVLAPQHSPNTDAIDPFSSKNIVIDHDFADVGDDDIAIKSGLINSPGPDDPSENIKITDCVFKHGHGLSIGSEIAGGAQNIVADHVSFEGTDNGIRVKANRDRGHDVSNLVFRNIEMKNVKNAIVISEYYPSILPKGGVTTAPVTRLTPFFHNITLENVTAEGGLNAGAIVGLPESPVKNVVLKNVHVEATNPLVVGYADVVGDSFTVKAASGDGIEKRDGANLTLK